LRVIPRAGRPCHFSKLTHYQINLSVYDRRNFCYKSRQFRVDEPPEWLMAVKTLVSP